MRLDHLLSMEHASLIGGNKKFSLWRDAHRVFIFLNGLIFEIGPVINIPKRQCIDLVNAPFWDVVSRWAYSSAVVRASA